MNCLLFRVDANPQIGWGHLMRCLAVADAWRDLGGRAVFAMRDSGDNGLPLARVRARGQRLFRVPPGLSTRDERERIRLLAAAVAAEWVVLDGYHFATSYQTALRDAGLGLAVFDDAGHLSAYDCDVLINGSPLAGEIHYQTTPATRQWLGLSYLPLRTEVRCCRRAPVPAAAGAVRRIVVTLGGGEAVALAQKILAGLRQLPPMLAEFQFLVGSAPATARSLADALRRAPDRRVHLVRTTEDLPARLAEADLAISAAGGTLWELAYLGVPTLALVRADNQRATARFLAEQGVVRPLGDAEQAAPETIAAEIRLLVDDPAARRAMALAGRTLLDGRGAARIARALQQIQMRLRPAGTEDRELIFRWANEPAARAQSFQPQAIAWDTHCEWFAAQLDDANTLLLVAHSTAGEPVGQVRFARRDDRALASISVARSFRGQGIGTRLLRHAAGRAFAAWPSIAWLEA
ncbi:MAG: UDP-2,4-diacetamido-2,4,6-trideoxy-beta-L-altropyranose hydrolase, partial [Planctomycetaceae bacterium]|nr:UDP-2,4-diacetamido-2,4,6-trideoxy-beta-L-altropyranose hydrolase [Planctomycetaceae bacterium]